MVSKLELHMRRRFCPLVKYTFSNGQYWDSKSQRFVSLRKYFYYIWCSSYYMGQALQVFLAFYILHLSFRDTDIPEMNFNHQSLNVNENDDELILSLGIVIWLVVTAILSVGSLTVEYQEEITESINQAFWLDSGLKRLYPGARLRSWNSLEKMVPWICCIPLTFPFIFLFAFFHPLNPIRTMFENSLEIELTLLSPMSWLILVGQTWAVTCFIGVGLGLLLPILAVVSICQHWLLDASFQLSNGRHLHDNSFRTNKLGNLSLDELLLIYRSLQLLTGVCNRFCQTVRLAYHSAGSLMTFVFSSYILIKKGPALLSGGSIMSFALATILVVALSICVLLFYVECLIIDELENRWRTYKNNILTSKSRRTRVYKTAISFRTVTVMTTYPFCNVNRSTFLEWMNVCIDNLVSLLLI